MSSGEGRQDLLKRCLDSLVSGRRERRPSRVRVPVVDNPEVRFGRLFLVAALVVPAGCDGRDQALPRRPSPTSETEDPSACSNQADVGGSAPSSGSLTGDVTGDGVDDTVHLVRDPKAEIGCRDFLVVEAGEGTFVTSVSDGDTEPALSEPRLQGGALVDGKPGTEILVLMETGASTQFLGMFTMFEERLTRVRLQPRPDHGDLFPYGGSVGHIEASDCGAEEGEVIVSLATPVRNRYEVIRTIYRFDGPRLLRDAEASERVVVAPARVQSLPEFRSSPFGSCPQPEGGA